MFQEIALRILRFPEVSQATGLSRSTIYRLVRSGTFPQSVALTARTIGWRIDEVEAWIAARAATSKNQADD